MSELRKFLVVTPPFEYVEPVTDEGQGPTVTECDTIEVEARSKQGAVLMGVKAMLEGGRKFTYCREQRMDGASPFTGVKAIDLSRT